MLEIDTDRFLIDGPHPSSEFCSIHQKRVEQIAPFILPNLPRPVVSYINQIIPGENCSFVGIIYKELANRQSDLDNYKEIGGTAQKQTLTISPDDKVYVEDSTGRIHLIDINPAEYTSGVVVGVHGRIEHSKSKFHVISMHFATFDPMASPAPYKGSVAFVSSLAINSKNFDRKAAMNMKDALKQCDLCVVLGNCFDEAQESDKTGMLSFQAKMQARAAEWPITQLASYLSACKTRIVLLPGSRDPSPLRLPQLPYHKCLMKGNYELVTNPSRFRFGEQTFICGAGESPEDVANTTSMSFHEAQKALLDYRHLAPTAPDDLPCVAVVEKDLLVLDELPNVFVCGLAPKFEVSEHRGVKVISVPAFSATKSAVFYDMESGEVIERCFADRQ